MKTGIELITEERQRQISEEGWSDEHDDTHDMEEMAEAASIYAQRPKHRRYDSEGTPVDWPWLQEWWKPCPHDRVRELVKAGALMVAEIDRLQRKDKP